jgi:hypothetical protein
MTDGEKPAQRKGQRQIQICEMIKESHPNAMSVSSAQSSHTCLAVLALKFI